MQVKVFGRTGLRVSEVALGAMAFGNRSDAPSQHDVDAVIDVFQASGGNLIDTAVTYGEGWSERMIGNAVRGRRDQFVLSSKYGLSRDVNDLNGGGSQRKNLRLSVEMSLTQLGTDYVDIYWVHAWDRFTPIDETLKAVDDLVRAGKVLHVGMSNAPAWVIAQGNALADRYGWSGFSGIQVPYNIVNRDVERELMPMAECTGLSVMAWGPLAHGQLAKIPPQVDKVNGALIALQDVAKRLEVSPAQVALAWLLSRSGSVIPILGVTSVDQLVSNMSACDLVIPQEDLDLLSDSTDFDLGYPRRFLEELPRWAFGAAGDVGAVRGILA